MWTWWTGLPLLLPPFLHLPQMTVKSKLYTLSCVDIILKYQKEQIPWQFQNLSCSSGLHYFNCKESALLIWCLEHWPTEAVIWPRSQPWCKPMTRFANSCSTVQINICSVQISTIVELENTSKSPLGSHQHASPENAIPAASASQLLVSAVWRIFCVAADRKSLKIKKTLLCWPNPSPHYSNHQRSKDGHRGEQK